MYSYSDSFTLLARLRRLINGLLTYLLLKAHSHCARQRTLTSVKDARQRPLTDVDVRRRILTDTYSICKLYVNDIQRHYLRHYLLLKMSDGALSPFGEGAVSPFNTKSPGSRRSSIPSDILIHAAIWPQQIWAENWGVAPLGKGELGPHLTQCGRG